MKLGKHWLYIHSSYFLHSSMKFSMLMKFFSLNVTITAGAQSRDFKKPGAGQVGSAPQNGLSVKNGQRLLGFTPTQGKFKINSRVGWF